MIQHNSSQKKPRNKQKTIDTPNSYPNKNKNSFQHPYREQNIHYASSVDCLKKKKEKKKHTSNPKRKRKTTTETLILRLGATPTKRYPLS